MENVRDTEVEVLYLKGNAPWVETKTTKVVSVFLDVISLRPTPTPWDS